MHDCCYGVMGELVGCSAGGWGGQAGEGRLAGGDHWMGLILPTELESACFEVAQLPPPCAHYFFLPSFLSAGGLQLLPDPPQGRGHHLPAVGGQGSRPSLV